MSAEITILVVTAITASLLYISKHLMTSKCWTKEECCSIKLRSNSSSIITPPIESPMNYRDNHAHTKCEQFKPPAEPVEEEEPTKPVIVSSVI